MTHDLLHSILTQVQVKVKEVKIVDLKDNTYYATLSLESKKGVIEMDARPSDAIILALKSKIPILVATKILNEQGIALTQKSLHGERFGIRIQELTPALASHFNFKDRKGVLVAEVVPSSVSEAAGIKAGDIITKVNSKEVGSVQEFEVIFDRLGSDNSVQILLFRDNKSQEVNLFLK
jgi:bifunctional DNase/RNase